MHIGIDGSCWANKRGYGRYTRELVTAILDADRRNEYTLFLDSSTKRQCDDLPDRAPLAIVETSLAAADAASASGHRSLADLWAMSRAVARSSRSLDLFYFPSVYTFFPVSRRLKPLVTIHDTIAERHPDLIFPRWRNRLFWSLKVRWAIRQASMILTVSQTAKAAVMKEFALPDSSVRVVYDAVGPRFQAAGSLDPIARVLEKHDLGTDSRFLLYVGGISPHKNIEVLIDAFCVLREQAAFRDLKLVLIGDVQTDAFFSNYRALQARIQMQRADRDVIFTGFVPDEDLPHWYSSARVLVLPSVDEGFGLPALEAMACGTPVVASRGGALPEVVGDAGLLFDPRSCSELVAALSRVLSDTSLHSALSSKGLDRARQFTWQESAQAAIELFEEVSVSPNPRIASR